MIDIARSIGNDTRSKHVRQAPNNRIKPEQAARRKAEFPQTRDGMRRTVIPETFRMDAALP